MMRRVRQTLCIMAAATAALNAIPAEARDSASKRQGTQQGETASLSSLVIVDAGSDHAGPANSYLLNANQCRDCNFEQKSTRQFMPGDMTLKFRPVGGTFSLHF